jgi:hypothetical protein
MKANDRARLTTALRDHVAKIAADLRGKMRAPGATRVAAEQLHKDERVAEDFEVWTDLLSRRAAVLWVLKTVYVRVLEDRGLLQPGRLLDPEAQQLFEKLAPNLGETAFLRWIYKDLASTRGGVPELFSLQPAEVALPSDELSRALIAFWRHRDVDGDADSGAVWSFAEEKFEGELMGDLYQELDPVVKDRFALCQTPDFVRAFILDRTLTPAIETFGADEVRLLDPACGSGHFLIDGLKRLVTATAEKHEDWSKEKVVEHALDRVVGVDLNDYACALARTRLVMTAAELAGVTKLADAARFHPHVYWADGLEQVEKEEQKPSTQFDLFTKVEEKPRATLTRSDVRAALKKVFEKKFHAVVANPPYNTESDNQRKEYHREKVGKKQRYVSAYRQYSLGSPFTERCFQLAEKDGYVGLITSNNFMKRDFGKPLIEQVIAGIDLTLVVDTGGAILADSGFETPTVILTARNRKPASLLVPAIMGKKKDTSREGAYSERPYWRSILAAVGNKEYEDGYVSLVEVRRTTFAKHPWSLGGGGTSELKEFLDRKGVSSLKDVIAAIGRTNVVGHDDVWIASDASLRRRGLRDVAVPFVIGETVRDWTIVDAPLAIYPYSEMGGDTLPASHPLVTVLWPWRTLLERRTVFGKEIKAHGRPWWEHLEHYADRLRTPLSITFAFVSTHNQFVLDRGGKVFKQTAPIIKLPDGATEEDHLTLLGILNSSAACFWFRQALHAAGGRSTGTKRQSEEWAQRLEFAGGRVEELPIPQASNRIAGIARQLDALASEIAKLTPSVVLESLWTDEDLPGRLQSAQVGRAKLRAEMVAWQEELDWEAYAAYGIVESRLLPLGSLPPEAIDSAHRPFAILLARKAAHGEATRYWFDAMGVQPTTEVPDCYRVETRALIEARLELIQANSDLARFETPECKRKWEPLTWKEDLETAAFAWLSGAVEAAQQARAKPATRAHLVAAVQAEPRFLALATLYQQRQNVDVEGLVAEVLAAETVPNHPFHVYTSQGLAKRSVWEETWALQRREDAGEKVNNIPVPPEYSQGSRGKSVDFLKTEYWKLRGALDVPKERFIAFTEVPGRAGGETLYGWAGWTAQQRVKAILAIDEELEDAAVPLADRIGLLDSAWRLLPDVAREDAAAATRLRAELQALVGPEGPSTTLIDDWKKRFPPPSSRASGARKTATTEVEKDNSLDDLPSVIPNVSDEEHAAILIWALIHASGGTATRMDLARAFALRARPALLKKLAPASLKGEVAHWLSTVGSRSVKAGLLASTLGALAARRGVTLGTNGEGRATVSASSQTPSEAQIDSWFHFEANLALKVLRAQAEEKLGAIDQALKGADRKLLEAAA